MRYAYLKLTLEKFLLALICLFGLVGCKDEKPEQKVEKPIEGAALMKSEAVVSESLRLEYAGPKGVKPAKPGVNMAELEDRVAPLPQPEAPSVDDRKNLPARKELKTSAALHNIETEAKLVEELDQKMAESAPSVPLSNTLAVEQAEKAPHSLSDLEVELSKNKIDKIESEIEVEPVKTEVEPAK